MLNLRTRLLVFLVSSLFAIGCSSRDRGEGNPSQPTLSSLESLPPPPDSAGTSQNGKDPNKQTSPSVEELAARENQPALEDLRSLEAILAQEQADAVRRGESEPSGPSDAPGGISADGSSLPSAEDAVALDSSGTSAPDEEALKQFGIYFNGNNQISHLRYLRYRFSPFRRSVATQGQVIQALQSYIEAAQTLLPPGNSDLVDDGSAPAETPEQAGLRIRVESVRNFIPRIGQIESVTAFARDIEQAARVTRQAYPYVAGAVGLLGYLF